MSKETFSHGDYVVGIKWNGEEIMGTYNYSYSDDMHCMVNAKDKRTFLTRRNAVRKATNEEIKKIKNYLKCDVADNNDELEQALAAVE